MNSPQRNPLPIIFFAGALALTAFTGWRFWSVWRENSELKVRLPGAILGDLESLAEQRRKLDEANRVAMQRLSRLSDDCAQLQKNQMPLTAAATRELQLQVLELARRCEFEIEEISPVNAAKNSNGAAPAPNGNERPQVRLQCQAEFLGIVKFVAGLSGLKWTVTPESFSIAQPESSTTDEDGVKKNQQWQAGESLNVTMVLTF